jgi:hypothetical protein
MNDMLNISWSLGETGALAAKAARGTGMPWGLADEAGFAVSWLHAHGLPGVATFCRYLNWCDTGTMAVWPDEIGPNQFYCPIRIGTAFIDGALSANITIDAVREPFLMLPFIGKRTGLQPLQVQFGDLNLYVSQNGLAVPYENSGFLVSRANCTIRQASKDAPKIAAPENPQRVASYHFACIQTLHKFAKKTYAPATEESRLAGAGAGLSDND